MENSLFLPNFLKQRAFLTPDRIALSMGKYTCTFRELYQTAVSWAGALHKIGLTTGGRAGVLIKNTKEGFFMLHALQQAGVTAVMLNNRLTAEELQFQLNDANVEAVVFDEEFSGLAADIEKSVPTSKVFSLKEIVKQKLESFEAVSQIAMEDVCTIMYTSGTTGKPKGVLQSYNNHWWSAIGSALNLGLKETDVWLCSVPLFHISGYSILMRSIIYGIELKLLENFDEKAVNYELKTGGASIISVVSAMLQRLLSDLGDESYHERFRCMLLGGGPAPKSMLEECKNRGIPVYQTYGMTETASQFVTLSPEDSLTKLGSAGKPLFPCELRIMKGNRQAGINEEGEIAVRGPNVTKGYLNRKDANEKSFMDGWFLTGDIGLQDSEGFLYVLDRRSDLIISGGENVYPAEIESVLLSHPDIRDAGVIGVESKQWGQVASAFLVTDPSSLSASELQEYCRKRLAGYKVPHHFYIVESLPRNASNKLLRKDLKNLVQKERIL